MAFRPKTWKLPSIEKKEKKNIAEILCPDNKKDSDTVPKIVYKFSTKYSITVVTLYP